VLVHDCVISHGDSGAPLLATGQDGTAQVVGVTVGFWTLGGHRVGIAAPVTAAILPTAQPGPAQARR
jgi:V8-like Glu-specific endopeptidase